MSWRITMSLMTRSSITSCKLWPKLCFPFPNRLFSSAWWTLWTVFFFGRGMNFFPGINQEKRGLYINIWMQTNFSAFEQWEKRCKKNMSKKYDLNPPVLFAMWCHPWKVDWELHTHEKTPPKLGSQWSTKGSKRWENPTTHPGSCNRPMCSFVVYFVDRGFCIL